jgi:HK97 family phage major capsid protein
MPDAKTLGEFAAKNLNLDAVRNGSAKSAGTGFGFKAATDPQTSQQMLETSRVVTDTAVRDITIRNLFGAEAITGNALKYFILGAKEGTNAPGTVAENGAKPQFHIGEGSDTATLQKVAGWFYETDELLEDNAFLKSAIDARGLYELDSAIEAYLMTTLLATSGLGAIAQAPTADNIFQAIMQVKTATGFDADAIVINPTDYQTLRLAKDGGTTGQYYGGGYFYGPYGNGGTAQQPGLWGLNTVVSNVVTAGTVLVGAFRQGASVLTKAGDGTRVEVVTGDHDDRTNNRVTVIVEERLGLAVRYPGAFVKVAA